MRTLLALIASVSLVGCVGDVDSMGPGDEPVNDPQTSNNPAGGDLAAAKKKFDDWLNRTRKGYEKEARQSKIDALSVTEDEKLVLKDESKSTRAKDLAKKFSKELKVDDKDYRKLVSREEREEWDALEKKYKI